MEGSIPPHLSLPLSPALVRVSEHADYEISFLRLLDSISNGSKIKINETGTKIRFESGFLVGGSNLVHKCPNSRAVVSPLPAMLKSRLRPISRPVLFQGYFLEPLMLLAPFCKSPLRITLTGVTNGPDDLSVDTLRVVTLPLLKRFGVENTQGVELALKVRHASCISVLKGGMVLIPVVSAVSGV